MYSKSEEVKERYGGAYSSVGVFWDEDFMYEK